ncbi:MOSC domain-containing protein [Chimaeribacter coloradensis]|uniref:MOSC domain-containing protein n=1 Tax=Chimaeribacter coloradensis TaxID=2060068 RepID=A0A2N5E3D8_9GAMM|nr:6-hydroxyaminopurine reductase [Chimaeribacter coloradensis]PLR35226.1 MOSC domain-containing protein [Chimaeribacter coloradensis]
MHYPQVFIGPVRAFDTMPPSGISKRAAEGRILLTPLGLEGDEQAETRFHGGPDRALCHFPREHYAHLSQQFPQQAEHFQPPGFGENISTLGLTEQNVFIGDIFRWGEALIQVTQPRSPCYKMGIHLGVTQLSHYVQQSGRCGWLYRVLSPGYISDGQPLALLTRNSEVSVAEAISIAFNQPYDEEQYRRLLSAAGLAAAWSQKMQARLESRKIEDFSRRLDGTPRHN